MQEPFITNPEMTHSLERDARRTRGTKIFGAALVGEFPGFFRDSQEIFGEWLTDMIEAGDLPDMPYSTTPSRIIVVGDTDFATNMLNATGASKNLDFLLRATDWLVSDDDIIGIRNREPHIGRFDKILDEEKRAAAIRFVKIINLGVVPFFVIAAGLFIAYRRKKRSLKESPDA